MTLKEKQNFIKEYQNELIEYGIEREFYDMKKTGCGSAVIMEGWEWVELEDSAGQVLDDILDEFDYSIEQIKELIGG